MRRILIPLSAAGIIVAAILIVVSDSVVVQVVAGGVIVAILIAVVSRLLGSRQLQPPRSQVTEVERLYFRAMREMLNEQPNFVQVINDLQRVLTIDKRYKNARHYLQRAISLQGESGLSPADRTNGRRTDFYNLQERLIDDDPAIRKSIIMELIQYGNLAVDPLIALLMDEDADVRVHAATALGWVGGKDAVHPLLVALEDADVQVRRYAARAMCWVVDETAVEGLIVALDDDDNYVRCYSARALGWSHDDRAVAPLTELINHDNADVREYATTALLDLGQQLSA